MTTTIFTQALTANDSNRSNVSLRQQIKSLLAGPGSDTHFRITFETAATAGVTGFGCNNVGIGKDALTATFTETTITPTAVTFNGGSSSFLKMSPGGSVSALQVSDNMPLAGSGIAAGWNTTTDKLVVIMDLVTHASNAQMRNITTAAAGYSIMLVPAGNPTWNVASGWPTGTSFGTRIHGVTMIEILTPGSSNPPKLIGGSLLYSPLLDGRLVR